MNRKEAKNWLNKLYAMADITDEYGDMEDMQPYEEAVDMAIKSLEQEPVLDKIRAEIEDIALDLQELDGEHESCMVVDLNDALNIIDKYKAEGRDEE